MSGRRVPIHGESLPGLRAFPEIQVDQLPRRPNQPADVRRRDPFETHSHLYESSRYVTNRGYEVLSVNYRGGAGYGFFYREPQGFGAAGASELNDIIGEAKYLGSRPDVDPKRLGVWAAATAAE